MKGKKRLDELYQLFSEGESLTMQKIKEVYKINEHEAHVLISLLRRGTKVLKDGTCKRPSLNVQSVPVKSNKNLQLRIYKLISRENSSPFEEEYLLNSRSKTINTIGKYTWMPTANSLAKHIPLGQFKKLLLGQQAQIIDTFFYEGKEAEGQ